MGFGVVVGLGVVVVGFGVVVVGLGVVVVRLVVLGSRVVVETGSYKSLIGGARTLLGSMKVLAPDKLFPAGKAPVIGRRGFKFAQRKEWNGSVQRSRPWCVGLLGVVGLKTTGSF